MGDRKEIRITLDISPSGRPFAGTLRQTDGERQVFSGVLELLALIEAVRAGDGQAPDNLAS